MRIGLIGAGQIGSRHLQAIGRIAKWPLEVHVVEVAPAARALALERFLEVLPDPDSSPVKVTFSDEIEQLPTDLELAIVATSAAVRRTCVERLLAHSSVKYLILEKILFQREADYPAIAQLLRDKGTHAWVNCSRRLWPVYQTIREELAGNAGPIELQVTGTNWGLGSNAIHLLDIFSFLTNENEIELSHQKLDSDQVPNKRAGYIEFTGLLTGKSPRGSIVSLLSNRSGSMPFMVAVAAAERRYLIMEGFFQVAMRNPFSSNWEVRENKALLTSESTTQVVEMLLKTGSCLLPSFEESTQLHLRLLRCLNDFLERQQGGRVTLCPIT